VTGEHTGRLCTSPNPVHRQISSQGPAADVRMARRRSHHHVQPCQTLPQAFGRQL